MIFFREKKMRLSRLSSFRKKLNFCDNCNNRQAIIAIMRLICWDLPWSCGGSPLEPKRLTPGTIEARPRAMEANPEAMEAGTVEAHLEEWWFIWSRRGWPWSHVEFVWRRPKKKITFLFSFIRLIHLLINIEVFTWKSTDVVNVKLQLVMTQHLQPKMTKAEKNYNFWFKKNTNLPVRNRNCVITIN